MKPLLIITLVALSFWSIPYAEKAGQDFYWFLKGKIVKKKGD